MNCPMCGHPMKLDDDMFICQYCETQVPDKSVQKSKHERYEYKRVDVYNHDERRHNQKTKNTIDKDMLLHYLFILGLVVALFLFYLLAKVFNLE